MAAHDAFSFASVMLMMCLCACLTLNLEGPLFPPRASSFPSDRATHNPQIDDSALVQVAHELSRIKAQNLQLELHLDVSFLLRATTQCGCIGRKLQRSVFEMDQMSVIV